MDRYRRVAQATCTRLIAKTCRWPSALRICCLVWSAQRSILTRWTKVIHSFSQNMVLTSFALKLS